MRLRILASYEDVHAFDCIKEVCDFGCVTRLTAVLGRYFFKLHNYDNYVRLASVQEVLCLMVHSEAVLCDLPCWAAGLLVRGPTICQAGRQRAHCQQVKSAGCDACTAEKR